MNCRRLVLFPALFLLLISFLSAQRILLDDLLNQGWQLYNPQTAKQMMAKVPGNVLQDLCLNEVVFHPFYHQQEYQERLRWVEKTSWPYELSFYLPDSLRDAKRIRIFFERLDTECSVSLNGGAAQKSRNMFVPFSMDVTDAVQRGRGAANVLHVEFSPFVDNVYQYNEEHLIAETAGNDAAKNKVSPFIRKAPYHFGWDWAPRLVMPGIRGNVWLVVDDTEEKEKTPPLPRVELVREMDLIGESYFFRINGEPVFMKGANYIPQDEYFPVNRHARIKELLLSAKESGFNMIRVWGGGIYEEDFFYDLCDSLGIYVWQDFMFACSMYPADKEFRMSVKEEAEAQVQRLRHHPCIVLWCGNNEIEVAWKNWGWQQQIGIHDDDSVRIWHNYLYLFDTLLRSVVQEFDPGRPYVSTSPLSNWGAPERFNSGDNHYWGVWHGEEPFENFRNNVPRFMSEYGFQSFPDLELMQVWGAPADTSVFRWHQKSYKGSRLITQFAEEWFGESEGISEQIRDGQFAQAEAYRIAIGSHRAAQPRCMGTLYWQLNDCWPGPSWSSMDYALNWKPLQYMVKRMYADHLLIPIVEDSVIRIHFSNHDQEAGKGILTVQLKNFSGKVINSWKDEVHWKANTSQLLAGIPMEKWAKHTKGTYVVATLEGAGFQAKDFLFFGKPADLRLPSRPGIEVLKFIQTGDGGTLTLRADKFAKGVWLEIPLRDDQGKLLYRFSDNYFDLEAGEEKTIKVMATGELRTKIIPDPVITCVNK